MKTYYGEVPRKYENQNKKLVVLRDQLRKLDKDINKTVDQIDAILGCKGYHDIDEFYPK